jgi:hypothetical protein
MCPAQREQFNETRVGIAAGATGPHPEARQTGRDAASWHSGDIRPGARGHVSTLGGEAPIHSEGRWTTAAVGDTDGPRPGGADGRNARAAANCRGGLSPVLVRLSAEADCDAGARNITHARRARRQPRPRRRHSRLLRQHRP